MSEDVAAKAMTPFFTTKSSGMGTGLGLSMVSETMRSFGGTALLESRLGEGTEVRLYFRQAD